MDWHQFRRNLKGLGHSRKQISLLWKEHKKRKNYFESCISSDILKIILDKLPPQEEYKCRRVCKSWKKIIDDSINSLRGLSYDRRSLRQKCQQKKYLHVIASMQIDYPLYLSYKYNDRILIRLVELISDQNLSKSKCRKNTTKFQFLAKCADGNINSDNINYTIPNSANLYEKGFKKACRKGRLGSVTALVGYGIRKHILIAGMVESLHHKKNEVYRFLETKCDQVMLRKFKYYEIVEILFSTYNKELITTEMLQSPSPRQFGMGCRSGDINFVQSFLNKIDSICTSSLDPIATRASIWNFCFMGACASGNMEIIKLCFNNKKNHDLNLGLRRAAEQNHLAVVKFLLKRGATDMGLAIHGACKYGHLAMVEYLFKYRKSWYWNSFYGDCIRLASERGYLDIIKFILVDRNFEFNLLKVSVKSACKYNWPNMVYYIININSNVNQDEYIKLTSNKIIKKLVTTKLK